MPNYVFISAIIWQQGQEIQSEDNVVFSLFTGA